MEQMTPEVAKLYMEFLLEFRRKMKEGTTLQQCVNRVSEEINHVRQKYVRETRE